MVRKLEESLDFKDILIVPTSECTIDPDDVKINFELGGFDFKIPFIASAMDGIVDVNFAVEIGKLGGLAILNLHGIHTRYKNVSKIYKRIMEAEEENVIKVLQEIYSKPIDKELIVERIRQIKERGVICAVSSIPIDAEEFGYISEKAGADIFFVQSTVTSYKHISSKQKSLSLTKLCKRLKIPVIVGNCASYEVAYKLMTTGVKGVIVGIGPGAACTTRYTIGIGLSQVSATLNVTKARDDYYKKTGIYIPVIVDGGIKGSDDVAKAFAVGADAVMIGSLFASCVESPGGGYNWGMASSHPFLPRGKRIKTQIRGSLEEILFGPSTTYDGTMNLVGALKNAIGICGARDLKSFRKTRLALVK